jgi:choline-sulfatase
VHEVVELIDVMPTVLNYLGIEAPRAIRGRTLWPLIHGQIEPERIALTEHAGRNLVALRSAQYKYIRHLRTRRLQPSYPFKRGSEELYDLSVDPGEKQNIADKSPELIAMFRRELKERRRQRLDMDIGQAQLNEDTIEVLRALGYVR